MSANDANRLFTRLFAKRTTAPVFITSLGNDKSSHLPPKFITTREFDSIHEFRMRWDQAERALYYCVSTIKEGQSRSKDNVAELTCLFCDIDLRNIQEPRAQVLEALEQELFPPHIIVLSGHGFHCYWILTIAYQATKETIVRFERALRRIAVRFSGDPIVCQVAALLRVPGSHNTKFGEWREVKIEREIDGTYDLDALEAWLADDAVVLHSSAKPKRLGNGNGKSNGNGNGKPLSGMARFAHGRGRPPLNWEQELAAMTYHGAGETSIHWTQLRVMASMLRNGIDLEEAIQVIFDATAQAAGPEWSSWDHAEEYHTLQGMGVSWYKKHPEYTPEGRDHSEGEARREHQDHGADEDKDEDKYPVIRVLSFEDLMKLVARKPSWLVDQFILEGVTGLFGHGATGKDWIMLQLAIAITCGGDWLGEKINKFGRVIYFASEEDDETIRWRAEGIVKHFQGRGLYHPEPGWLKIVPMLGEDTIIAANENGIVRTTLLYESIRRMISEHEPMLVIMCNRVNLFSVHQNDDSQARQSMRLLYELRKDFGCSIIMPSHVSLGQISEDNGGRGTSGSVQWENALRHRLWLKRIEASKEERLTKPTLDNKRLLEVMKSNMGPQNASIALEWNDGVFILDEQKQTEASMSEEDIKKRDRTIFLELVDEFTKKGQALGTARESSQNYGPHLMAKHLAPHSDDEQKRYKLRMEAIMGELLDDGTIIIFETGVGTTRHRKYIRRAAKP